MDSLLNVLADPRVALLFLVPGVGETLQVNGTARISVDPALLERFAMDGKLPRSVLIIDVPKRCTLTARPAARPAWTRPRKCRAVTPSTGRILSA